MRYPQICLWLLMVTAWALGTLHERPAVAEDAAEQHATSAESHAAQEHGAEEHGGDPNPLTIDPDLAIWTVVVFAVLMFVLSKFAWPAISEALEEREKRIEDHIASAEAKHEESKNLLAEHEAKLAHAAGEVRELLEKARRDAEHIKAQIVSEAKQAADQERDRAVRDVERAADHAMKGLAETSANLAVDLASKVVRQNITADQQAQMVRDALQKLAASSPSEN